MKSKFTNDPDSSGKSRVIPAAAVICGYWVSQLLALYFVSGSLMGLVSKIAGALALGLFALFFILHFFRPWSKSAAILGLCSLGLWAGFVGYLYSDLRFSLLIPSAGMLILLSLGLAVTGMAFDLKRCRQLLANAAAGCCPLSLRKNVLTDVYHAVYPFRFDTL